MRVISQIFFELFTNVNGPRNRLTYFADIAIFKLNFYPTNKLSYVASRAAKKEFVCARHLGSQCICKRSFSRDMPFSDRDKPLVLRQGTEWKPSLASIAVHKDNLG